MEMKKSVVFSMEEDSQVEEEGKEGLGGSARQTLKKRLALYFMSPTMRFKVCRQVDNRYKINFAKLGVVTFLLVFFSNYRQV